MHRSHTHTHTYTHTSWSLCIHIHPSIHPILAIQCSQGQSLHNKPPQKRPSSHLQMPQGPPSAWHALDRKYKSSRAEDVNGYVRKWWVSSDESVFFKPSQSSLLRLFWCFRGFAVLFPDVLSFPPHLANMICYSFSYPRATRPLGVLSCGEEQEVTATMIAWKEATQV